MERGGNAPQVFSVAAAVATLGCLKAGCVPAAMDVSCPEQVISQLRSPELAAAIKRGSPVRHRDPVFTFPGQGSQYAGMGRALHETEPELAAAFDECVEVLRSGLGLDLRGPVFGDAARPAWNAPNRGQPG